MKEKIQGILGMLIIGVFVFAIGTSIYRSNFSEPEFEILTSTKISAPIKNTLFWHEEELEKTSDVMVGAKLGLERTDFIQPLYNALKTTDLVNEEIKTMSEDATKRMIELDAYRGTEPDVWEIAKQNGKAYIFKTTITNVSSRKGTSDLKSVTYLFTIYDVTTKSVIWEARTWRSAGFFGGMPKGEETITIIENKLKEAKII